MKDNFTSTITKEFIPYQLPSNWEWFFWSDLISKYQQGMIRSNSQLGKGNAEYLKMGDLNSSGQANFSSLARTEASKKEIEEFLLKEGDFLINVRNSKELVGKTCIIENINSRIVLFNHMLVRMDHGCVELNYYINSFLNIPSSKKMLDRIKQGTTTVIALYQRDLNKLPISLPDSKTFNLIVRSCKSINSKIELNKKINAELEAMAKTLYDYWFVQFDFPNTNEKPYKTSGGKMVWSEDLKREIPEGWEVKKIEEIENNIITGKTPSTKDEENFGGEIPFVTIDDIRKQLYVFFADRTLTKKGADSQANKYLQPGDICVSCIGTIGVIGIIGTRCQTNQQINSISNIKDYNRFFLLNALKDYFNFNVAAKKGAVLDNMNKGDFSIIPILDAPNNLKIEYNRIVDSFYTKIENNLKENQELASLRDWLLPMLMNGQVSVGEVGKDYDVKDEVLGMVAEIDEKYNKR